MAVRSESKRKRWCWALSVMCLGVVQVEPILFESSPSIGDASSSQTPSSRARGLTGRTAMRPRVAVVVLAMAKSSPPWRDAFAVFAYSARKAFRKSRFQMDLFAFVQKGIEAEEKRRLKESGFRVEVKPLPVPRERMQMGFGRDEFSRGCGARASNKCWEEEMMKLYGTTLTEYDRVVVCDGDTLFIQDIDEVLGLDSHPLLATFDHELDFHSFTADINVIPLVNSGWYIVKPNLTDYDGIVKVAEEGDFRKGSGWRGSRVGWGYGGVATQGLLAYWYHFDALQAKQEMQKAEDLPGRMTRSPPLTRMHVLDRSVYNVIETRDLLRWLANGTAQIKDIRVFHFTGLCTKPWFCHGRRSEVCNEMQDKWWQLREELANEKGWVATERCKPSKPYVPLRRK